MLILASGSPRRRALLATLLGDDFVVDSPDVDETVADDVDPVAEAVEVSARKARSVRTRHLEELVLGADTTLSVEGRSLGQAADIDEARAMLTAQSGQRSLVTTGLTLLGPAGEWGGAVSATVDLHDITDEQIDDYLDAGAWTGKAGALEVQGAAAPFVRAIAGCRGTVIGLPVCEVARLLDRANPCTADHCVADADDEDTT